MTEELLRSIITVGVALVGVLLAIAIAGCLVIMSFANTIAKSVAQGRNLRVAFALNDLTRAATLEALRQDPDFLQAVATYLGDSIKGEKGDPADPAEVALQLVSHAQALSTLKQGVVTHATAEVAQEARGLLNSLSEEINRQLVMPIGQLAQQRELLQSYIAELETVQQLHATAQRALEQAQSETAALRATAAQLEQLIAASDFLKRLLAPPQIP